MISLTHLLLYTASSTSQLTYNKPPAPVHSSALLQPPPPQISTHRKPRSGKELARHIPQTVSLEQLEIPRRRDLVRVDGMVGRGVDVHPVDLGRFTRKDRDVGG